MKRSYFTPLLVGVGSVGLLLAISLPSVAASFSGKVVDETGNPVPGVIIALSSFAGDMPPNRHQMPEPMFSPAHPSETDETGAFSITNIISPSVHTLMLLPEHETEYEFRGIEIEGAAFHLTPWMHRWQWGGFPFAIEPGADVKKVVITVRLRMRIRGRVLSADGTPLRNAEVAFSLDRRGVDGSGGGGRSAPKTLDADGYFVEYVNKAARFTVSVAYQGRSAESEEILLKDGQRHDELVLTLGDELQLPESEPVKVAPRFDRARFEAARKREREGMWAINPENRHAYKMIRCETREEAQARAGTQDAYLVAINNEAEQEWILEVFGQENFWIGLTEGGKGGGPHWDNGEPITYTKWDWLESTAGGNKPPQNGETSQNYFVLVGLTGEWQVARPDSPLIHTTERAILEKENLIIGAPELEGDVEKR